MRGPGGTDDVEGCGLRKIASGVLLHKSIGIWPLLIPAKKITDPSGSTPSRSRKEIPLLGHDSSWPVQATAQTSRLASSALIDSFHSQPDS
jgi:hypothetical protein